MCLCLCFLNVNQKKRPNDVFDRMIVVFWRAFRHMDLLEADNDLVRLVLMQIFHH